MSTCFFEQINVLCESSGLSAWIEPALDDETYDQMHVLTRVDEQGRNFMLRLVRVQSEPSDGIDTHMLDMAMILPFQVEETSFDDTARLLAATNLGLLIGGLGLVEADRVVLLRYVSRAPVTDYHGVMVLIDMLSYVATEVTPVIEQVATGKLRYAHLQEAVRKALAEGVPNINDSGVMRV